MTDKHKMNAKKRFLICCAAYLLIVILLIVITAAGGSGGNTADSNSENGTPATTAPDPGVTPTDPSVSDPTQANINGHMIEGVPTIQQAGLNAGCETYACTMLLQYLGYDIDEYRFADNYLICSPTWWDDDGTHYGPDMYSAMAGTAYLGFGVYAPAMAKSMNNYFTAVGSKQKAYPLEGKSLESLCKEYIDNDIPVMVWATTWMQEPNVGEYYWVVDYVDENARSKIGDTVYWPEHEHCLVLIGYDDENYYFADSYKGAVSHFEKDLCNERYEQIGTMAIVVK